MIGSSDLILLDLISSVSSSESSEEDPSKLPTKYKMHLFMEKSKQQMIIDDVMRSTSAHGLSHHSVYFGPGNAFSLEIAASLPEHKEALIPLLEASFECFPDKDYCILSIPHIYPSFPLLSEFVRITPKHSSNYPHELYVVHRSALRSELKVRVATPDDAGDIYDLFINLQKVQTLFLIIDASLSYSNCLFRSFVLLCEEQIIGLAVVREEYGFEILKNQYRVSDWLNVPFYKPCSQGYLEYFIVSPIFQRCSEFFIMELHRLTGYEVIYYKIYPSDTMTTQRDRPLASVIGEYV